MKAHAQAKYIRQSPNKVRRVVDLVRGLPVEEARQVLDLTQRRAAGYVRKVLDSAVANAEHSQRVDVDDLFVSKVYVDGGPTTKRFLPRAHGRATPLIKRTSHITVVVDERRSGAEE